jgi:hypothetical protein
VTSVTACTAVAECLQRLGGGAVEPPHTGDGGCLVGGCCRRPARARCRAACSAPGRRPAARRPCGTRGRGAPRPARRGRRWARGCGWCGPPPLSLRLRRPPPPPRRRWRRWPREGKCSGKAATLTAMTTRPPIAKTSLHALAAAMAPKSEGMVDQRGEEVGGADQRHVGRHLVDGRVVERARGPTSSDGSAPDGHVADQVGEQARHPTWRRILRTRSIR